MKIPFNINIPTRLGYRDKRALATGAIVIAAVIAYIFIIAPWLDDWKATRSVLADYKQKLEMMGVGTDGISKAKQQALMRIVPVVESPEAEDAQRVLFRDKFSEQLKKTGIPIKSGPGFDSSAKFQKDLGLKVLKLTCKTKCKFDQVLNLLANLNDNPYMIGIEQLRLQCDEKKRQDLEMTLTISTSVR
jgi:hypothetical protein